MELKIPATAAGQCRIQVGKFSDTGEFIVREEAVTENSFTDYGLSQIFVTRLGRHVQTADLPSVHAHLGEGSLGSIPSSPAALNNHKLTSAAMTKTSSVQSAKFETPGVYDSVLPWVRTTSCTITIAPQSVNRTYTEVGLGRNSASGDYLYTYALFRDSNGDPAGVTVLADEYITLTYVYQISMNWVLPQGIDVTGTGIPEGTKAFTVRGAQTRPAIQAYLSSEYPTSGWEGIDHKTLVIQGRPGSPPNTVGGDFFMDIPLNDPTYAFSSDNTEVQALSLIPSQRKTHSSAPGSMNNTSDTWYVVGVSTSTNPALAMFFNKGIPLTKDDAFNFSATLTLTPNWSNGTFMEDPDGDREPIEV